MRRSTLALIVAAITCVGCASGMRTPVTTTGSLSAVVASDEGPLAETSSTITDNMPVASPQRAVSPVSAAPRPPARVQSTAFHQPELEPYDPGEVPGEKLAPTEEIVTPAPSAATPFKAKQDDEANLDRFGRNILDVEVDIRPTAGVMPADRGAERFANEPVIDETMPSGEPADVLCAYTPWTICYRPLYFEDIGLERYGKNVGCLQTGLSGVRFFGSIAALPYKMTRRPPRSCECSNGFSRPGDCPLPGYGNRRLELDAALVEAAAITAVVYIIP